MGQVTGGTYRDSPLAYSFGATDWPSYYINAIVDGVVTPMYVWQQMIFPNHSQYWNPSNMQENAENHTSVQVGILPKRVETPWHIANSAEKYRYVYELASDSAGNCLFDFIIQNGEEWSSVPVPCNATDHATYWQMENQGASWATVQQFLDNYHLAIPAYPNQVEVRCRKIVTYNIIEEYKFALAPTEIRPKGTVTFNLIDGVYFMVNDYPQPGVVFVEGGCSVAPSFVRVSDDMVRLTLSWVNSYVPEHDTYPYLLEVRAPSGVVLSGSGTVKAGTNGSGSNAWDLRAGGLLGRAPIAGRSFQLIAYMKQKTTGSVTSVASWTLQEAAMPLPSPVVEASACTSSKSAAEATKPAEGVTFNIVIHRHTPGEDRYPTTPCYVGCSCKGYRQKLWSGVFPANTTTLTIPVTLSPNQLANENIVDQQYIYPKFITGNGTAYNAADEAVSYWVPNGEGFGGGLQVIPLEGPQGRIHVHSTPPGATFSVVGPEEFMGITPYDFDYAYPVGVYTIHWNDMISYTAPPNQTLTLGAGATISFEGDYTGGATPPVTPGGKAGLVLLLAGGLGLLALGLRRRRKH
jgi:hypothetical protein